MPLYEFFCRRCEKAFQSEMHIAEHDAGPPECPTCRQKDKVEKRLSTFVAVTSHKFAAY